MFINSTYLYRNHYVISPCTSLSKHRQYTSSTGRSMSHIKISYYLADFSSDIYTTRSCADDKHGFGNVLVWRFVACRSVVLKLRYLTAIEVMYGYPCARRRRGINVPATKTLERAISLSEDPGEESDDAEVFVNLEKQLVEEESTNAPYKCTIKGGGWRSGLHDGALENTVQERGGQGEVESAR